MGRWVKLLAPHNIYQKQKIESVYFIPTNNYGLFSEIGISLTTTTEKMMTSSKIWRHFCLFFIKQKISLLLLL